LRLRKDFFEPRLDAPLPTWMIFPVIFAALYASHFTLLRLPYYWDEAGYYIPAAWDFFRTGSLIPITTLTNAHPPLPSIYLALWWKASGFYPEVTREAVLMVRRWACWRFGGWPCGWWACGAGRLLDRGAHRALSHLVCAEHAGPRGHFCRRLHALGAGVRAARPRSQALGRGHAVVCRCGALSKETAIAIPLTLAVLSVEAFQRCGGRRPAVAGGARAAWLASCVLPLAAWYAWHYAKTGFLFGNPEFLRYNAQANMTPVRILAAFGHRILHLTAHMNLFVPVLMTIAALLLEPRMDAEGHERGGDQQNFLCSADFLLLLVNACCSACWAARCSRAICCPCIRWCCWWRCPRFTAGFLIGRGCGVFGGGVCAGAVHQSAVWLCAGRQSGLCARDPAAPGGHRAIEHRYPGAPCFRPGL
jgi:hypothetical protein